MPMPVLDPSRYVEAVLADTTHKLPLPDKGGRLFLESGEIVDSHDAFYAHLLGDGSLRLKPADAVPEPAATPPAEDSKTEAPAVTEASAAEVPPAETAAAETPAH